MDSKTRLPIILLGLVIAIIFAAITWTDSGEKLLKSDINDNFRKIDSLEALKDQYFAKIKADSIRLREKDSLIALLKMREAELLDSIKKNRYDYKETRRVYLSRDRNERVRIFADLARDRSD